MAFTCPRCSRTSHGPADEREGYCGACRAFTGRAPDSLAGEFERRSGAALAPAAVARYTAGQYGLSAEWSSGEVTIPHTDSESLPPEGTDWPGPLDLSPFGDAMQWSPGDTEW